MSVEWARRQSEELLALGMSGIQTYRMQTAAHVKRAIEPALTGA